MPDDALKLPLAISLDQLSRQRANDVSALMGKELPCHVTKVDGQMVTVAFDVKAPFTMPQVQMPYHTSIYDWIPVQVGDKGVARTADVYLGGVTGLGSGTADLSRRAPLSMLVFFPVANVSWMPPGGSTFKNYRIVQGPDGVVIRDIAGKSSVTVNAAGATMRAQGPITIQSDAEVTIKGTKIHLVPPT